MRFVLPLAIAAAVANAPSAQTGLTLIDRNANFFYLTYPATTTDTTGSMRFAANSTSHVAYSWWYYNVAGDTTGSAFNTGGGQMTAGNTADRHVGTLEWTNVDSRNFAAKLVNTIYSTGSTTGINAQSMTITNNTGALLSITIYAYTDIDVDGISSDDSATQMAGFPAGQTRVTDPSNNSVYFMGNSYAGWEAALWPTLRDNILTTNHTLANAGLPLANQDYSGAFSWTVTIAPGASQTFNHLLAINYIPRSTNVASAVSFGAAKAGTPGLPDWTLNRPFAATTANLQITNGLTGAAPIVFIGTTTTNFPLPPLGTVYVIPLASFSMPAFNASGVATLGLAVPALNSGIVHFQGLWADGGAAGGIAHTAGLTWSIGSF